MPGIRRLRRRASGTARPRTRARIAATDDRGRAWTGFSESPAIGVAVSAVVMCSGGGYPTMTRTVRAPCAVNPAVYRAGRVVLPSRF